MSQKNDSSHMARCWRCLSRLQSNDQHYKVRLVKEKIYLRWYWWPPKIMNRKFIFLKLIDTGQLFRTCTCSTWSSPPSLIIVYRQIFSSIDQQQQQRIQGNSSGRARVQRGDRPTWDHRRHQWSPHALCWSGDSLRCTTCVIFFIQLVDQILS